MDFAFFEFLRKKPVDKGIEKNRIEERIFKFG
jgi:hypothetical protein